MSSEMRSQPAVVILSAGSSKEKMPGLPVYKDSPAFLPVNSRSLGKHVVDFYLNYPISGVYLVVNSEDYEDAQKEFACFGEKLTILSIEKTESVLDTLQTVVPKLDHDEVIVNIVTSIPDTFLEEENLIGVNKLSTLIEGWSGVRIDGDHVNFMTKAESIGQHGYSFSGIFRAKRDLLVNSFEKIVGIQRRDLMSLIIELNRVKPIKLVHCSWYDCGRVQNYYKTRTKLFGSRFFNSISLDLDSGVLTKTSTNIEKLKRETEYIHQLPKELQVLYPRVIDSNFSGSKGVVQMEYYAYPSLAEVMLYWSIPDSMWESIFDGLHSTLNRFSSYKMPFVENSWREIYVDKVISRVAQFQSQVSADIRSSLFESDKIVINSESYLGWNQLKNLIELPLSDIQNENDSTVVHGDFCFNNILCEPYTGLVKLLDARGSFGEHLIGTQGDCKYDWAKLGHSILGRYDYIVNDLFSVDWDGAKFELKTYDRPWQSILDLNFFRVLSGNSFKPGIIEFIIGTLFISMPPLHSDSKKRQIAFYLQGIKFLNVGLKKLDVIKTNG